MGCCCSNVDKNADERKALLENEQAETTLPKAGSWFEESKLVLGSAAPTNIPKHRRLSSRVNASKDIEQELIAKVTSKIDKYHLNIETGLYSKMEEDKKNIVFKDNENWNTEIIEPFNRNELFQNECYTSHEIRLSKCLHIHRIVFILKIYDEWRSNRKQSNMIDIVDIVESLPQYSIIKLLNDYLHLNECHNCNDKNYSTLLEYITTNIDKCTIGICEMFARHYRDKDICDKDDRQRKNTYFGYIESNSVYLCQILDSIHCLCLHSDIKNYKMRQKLIKQIRNNNNTQSELINIDTKFITFIYNNNKNSLNIGERFHYWNKSYCEEEKYCNSVKYNNLRQEMFENNIYSISYRMWDDTYNKANKWKQSLRGKQLVAATGRGCNMCGDSIPILSPISITHIMVVLFYVNYEFIQFKFQNKAMLYGHSNKDFELLKKNNKEIGNWYKLFTECIFLYGEIIQSQQDKNNIIFYHALNQKQLFSNFNPNFKCFLPTTTSTVVIQNAFNFNDSLKENGIILALQQKEMSLNSIFMDCSFMSDYPLQKENIFYSNNCLHIIDIMEINSEPSEYINGVLLFNCIFNGKYFVDCGYCNFQSILITIINNQLTNRYKFDIKIDKYIQRLFEYFLQTNDKNKWIIKSEYQNLDKELQHKLLIFNQINKTNNFHEGIFVKKWREILNKKKSTKNDFKIQIAKEYVFYLKNVKVLKELNRVVHGEDIIYSLDDKKENVILEQSIINCKSEPNMYSLNLKLKKCPKHIHGINIEFEVCCKEIELNISSRNQYLKRNEMFETLIFAFWDLEMCQTLILCLAIKITNIVYK